VEKSNPKIWGTVVIFKKLPKTNISPTGEKSPNLITLPITETGFSITEKLFFDN
jgi:hypothetical protein